MTNTQTHETSQNNDDTTNSDKTNNPTVTNDDKNESKQHETNALNVLKTN